MLTLPGKNQNVFRVTFHRYVIQQYTNLYNGKWINLTLLAP
jgi:hypothetical protein